MGANHVIDNYSSNFKRKLSKQFKNHKIRFFRFNLIIILENQGFGIKKGKV